MCDGHIVYQGEAKKSTEYFDKIATSQYKFTCPRFANPADFFMKILSINYPIAEEDQNKIAFFKKSYDEHIIPKLNSEHR